MAFDFPSSGLTVGQIVTGPNNIQYKWDGTKWVAATASGMIGGPGITISDTAPASPSLGNLWFDSVGLQTYIWYTDPNSSQWTPILSVTTALGNYLPLTGGTLTGSLSIAPTTGIPSMNLNSASMGNARSFDFETAGISRWAIVVDGSNESGGNAGSNFLINRYPDAGGPAIDSPLTLNRSTGIASLTQTPTHPTPPAGDNSTNSATTAFVAPAVQAAGDNTGRNLIHNAQFNVAQRGGGPWTTSVYMVDRWASGINLDTASFSQIVMSDTSRVQIGDEAAYFSLANTFTGTSGAAAQTRIWQGIENIRRLANKTVTVSFWAQASAALRLGVNFGQYFGTGGSPSATAEINGQSVALTTSFARYSLTFNIPSVAGKTVGTNGGDHTYLQFWYSAGSTYAPNSGSVGVQAGSIYLWGVQVEIGNIATPFAKRDPADDLALCQRFYETSNMLIYGWQSDAADTYRNWSCRFVVQKRATPTSFTYTCSQGQVLSPTLYPDGWYANYNRGDTTTAVNISAWTASADL